ncbi:MAG TPA: HWE histidine kinase domain-containing protein [Devosia sp.]|jgi:PAS domain S-box-containing protein|nr:HWE histidine kinase domain-containing protein [Devosia sp.]
MSDVDAFALQPEIDAAAAFRLAGSPDYRAILDSLPAAIYTTDTDGTLTYFNRAAAEIAGREPRIGIDKWCISWKLYRPDGSPLPLEACPMAVAIREQRPVRGVDIVVERPDGGRVPALPFPTPLHDAAGRFIGAINLLVDISRLKSSERQVERHAAEQAALYRFTDRLCRAESEADVYDAALDAIIGALGCDRASVLLFDEAGVMRFVASRGLSPAYRAAVDGHSPWTPGDRDPAPIFVPDIMASDESERLKRIVKDEGLTALGFIPLTVEGAVIGKFMTYHDTAHHFSSAERDLAITIARQLGFAIDRRRTDRTLHESTERLRLATEAGKVGLWDWDIPGDSILWTDSLYAIHGVGKRTQSFAQWLDLVHPDSRADVLAAIDRALKDDVPYEVEVRTVRPDGADAWIYTNAVVLRDGAGAPLRMVGAAVDITKRKDVEGQRDLLVAELSHRVKNTLATVVSIARQSFAKGATLDSARKSFEGRLRALAQTHTRLAEANWESVPLAALIEDEIAPYRDESGNNLVTDGPPVSFTPKQAVVLGMAFHELATNAAKYGALSGKSGTVHVAWQCAADGTLVLDWRERGGPPVSPPKRAGFGRLLLERALAADLKGDVTLDFRPEGLACRITLPLGSAEASRPAA